MSTMQSPYSRPLVGCVLLATVALSGCDNQASSPSGSYFLPQAVIGVALANEQDQENAWLTLTQFANQHGLRKYRLADDTAIRPARRSDPYNLRMTEYLPPIDTLGFDLVLLALSGRCWAIQLHERTGNWTQSSVDAFHELHRSLQKSLVGSAHVIVRPTREQNWDSRQERRSAVDPQQPAAIEDICARMGLDPVPHLEPRA